MTNKFHGEGFSKEPIEGDEAARHRHMYKEVSEEWVSIDGAATVARAIGIIANVIKVGGPVMAVMLAFGAYAKSMGWF